MHKLKTFAQNVKILRSDLEAKDGTHNVNVDFSVWTGSLTAIRLEMSYRTEPGWGGDREEFATGLSWDEIEDLNDHDVERWLDDVLAEARQWIADIPSPEEIAHKAFMAQLGRLIDKGREVGVDVDFLNPLTAMMERLATNALEDKRYK